MRFSTEPSCNILTVKTRSGANGINVSGTTAYSHCLMWSTSISSRNFKEWSYFRVKLIVRENGNSPPQRSQLFRGREEVGSLDTHCIAMGDQRGWQARKNRAVLKAACLEPVLSPAILVLGNKGTSTSADCSEGGHDDGDGSDGQSPNKNTRLRAGHVMPQLHSVSHYILGTYHINNTKLN